MRDGLLDVLQCFVGEQWAGGIRVLKAGRQADLEAGALGMGSGWGARAVGAHRPASVVAPPLPQRCRKVSALRGARRPSPTLGRGSLGV